MKDDRDISSWPSYQAPDNLTPYKQGFQEGAVKGSLMTAAVIGVIAALLCFRKKK